MAEDLTGMEYLSIATAARLLDTTPRHIRYMVAHGQLRAYRLGRELRFAKVDVLALITPDSAEARAAVDPRRLAGEGEGHELGEASPATSTTGKPARKSGAGTSRKSTTGKGKSKGK